MIQKHRQIFDADDHPAAKQIKADLRPKTPNVQRGTIAVKIEDGKR
jgi:hypothetical protein